MPPTARPGGCGTALGGRQMVEGSLGDHTKEKMDRLLLPAPMGPGVGPEVIGAQRQPNQRHRCAWSSMVMHVGPWGSPRSQTLEAPLGQAQQRGGQPQFPIAPLCGRGWVGSYLQICPASPDRPHRCPKRRAQQGQGLFCSSHPLPLLQGSRDVLGPTRAFRAALLPERRTGDAHVSFVGVFVCFFFFQGGLIQKQYSRFSLYQCQDDLLCHII